MAVIRIAGAGVVEVDLVAEGATGAEEVSEEDSGEGEDTTSGGERLIGSSVLYVWRWWDELSGRVPIWSS